jgi:hypothetical protein
MNNGIYISRDSIGWTMPTLVDVVGRPTIISEAVNAFGHIIAVDEKVSIEEFADMITSQYDNEQATMIAKALKDTIEMTFIVYKNDKALVNDIIFKKTFAVSNVDASEFYAIKLTEGELFKNTMNSYNPDERTHFYSQLKTHEGGNFLSGNVYD